MMAPQSDAFWMEEALKEAQQAREAGEVPIGAILVMDGQEIARAHNAPIAKSDPSAHAEINCLRRAGAAVGNYRLLNSTLYVTVEPCAMCAGALLWARVRRVVYGCSDPKSGALGSVLDLSRVKEFNHKLLVTAGVLEEDCRKLLQDFFQARRKTKPAHPSSNTSL
jgi:tRNA(adenine34) deaminase